MPGFDGTGVFVLFRYQWLSRLTLEGQLIHDMVHHGARHTMERDRLLQVLCRLPLG